MNGKKTSGFTLIELLVVVSIIALLVSILLPALNRARSQSHDAWCLANMRGVMMAAIIYCENNADHLPFSGRDWPYMGSLDFPGLLMAEDLDPRNLHCPADREKPGTIAFLWQGSLGRPMNASDHLGGEPPACVQPEVDYSYYWRSKMWLDYDKTTGDLILGALKSWKLSSVKYPSRMIPYTCFFANLYPDKPVPHGRLGPALYHTPLLTVRDGDGHQAGFLDGHCAWVPITDIEAKGSSSALTACHWPYNLDWTMNGIQGFDTY